MEEEAHKYPAWMKEPQKKCLDFIKDCTNIIEIVRKDANYSDKQKNHIILKIYNAVACANAAMVLSLIPKETINETQRDELFKGILG